MLTRSNLEAPVFLVGATGVGKSAAAMELARSWPRGNAAILCMDAMQVYRGTDIGTGKPGAAERAEFPHGGLDLVDFDASFDVAQYLRHAAAFLQEQREAGRRVMIVGGTGLYFRALTRGLCEAPQGSDELRAELSLLSAGELRARLKTVDPAMLARVDASNPRRLARAIEVKETTGRSLREWQAETPEPLMKEYTAVWIQREKAELEVRIAARVEAMFAAGWAEEVRGLVEKYGMEAVLGFAGIGYREIVEGSRNKGVGGTPATESRGQLRSQMEFGNEGNLARDTEHSQVKLGNEGTAGDASAASCGLRPPGQQVVRATGEGTVARRSTATGEGLKGDIVVATRQYAKRQLTWFAREPNLRAVMLTGNQSFSLAAPALF
jgi:tRNA dimethylallyltransferase